jgi:hypothetical protein
MEVALRKARFDLRCEAVEVQSIADGESGLEFIFEIGARGCGRTETYQLACQVGPTSCRFVEDRLRTRQTHVNQP